MEFINYLFLLYQLLPYSWIFVILIIFTEKKKWSLHCCEHDWTVKTRTTFIIIIIIVISNQP